MSKELSAEWQQRIKKEAWALTNPITGNNGWSLGKREGIVAGYKIAATIYASQLIEAQERIKDLENSMRNIIRACGAADYLGAKRIANEALSPVNPKNKNDVSTD